MELISNKLISFCPFCNDTVRPHIGHKDITFFACNGCGAVTSFGDLVDEDNILPVKDAVAAYRRRPNER